MSPYAKDLWARARDSLRVAEHTLSLSPDVAASRAYYAAFYAVSALFDLEGREYSKHSAVEAAVHRDLVKAGEWSVELGQDYRSLLGLRNIGDYGRAEHVKPEEAQAAVEAAKRIVEAVRETRAEFE